MKTAVIVGAGDFPKKEYPLYLLGKADVVICCDSAFAAWLRYSSRHPRSGGKTLPDAVVGDIDSLPESLRKRYGDIIVHIGDQDDNDQTKALRHLLENYEGLDEIHIVGATGKREDHTIGNLSLLMEYARQYGLDAMSRPSLDIVSDYSTSFALRDSAELYLGEGRNVSIMTPDNSLRIKSEGLEWPLDDVVFDNWWKATLNRTVSPKVSLHFSHPSMVLVICP